jgi:hypothetical protein
VARRHIHQQKVQRLANGGGVAGAVQYCLHQFQPCFAANFVGCGYTGARACGVLGAKLVFACQPLFKKG